MTYNNLKSWFDNWEHDLEDLGFAERDEEGNLYIPEDQLARMANMDESCLSRQKQWHERRTSRGSVLLSESPEEWKGDWQEQSNHNPHNW